MSFVTECCVLLSAAFLVQGHGGILAMQRGDRGISAGMYAVVLNEINLAYDRSMERQP